MPRIAAALAVVLTVAFCIGFNTIRYPVVWAMTSGTNHLAPPASAALPATSAESTLAPAGSKPRSPSSFRAAKETAAGGPKSAKAVRPIPSGDPWDRETEDGDQREDSWATSESSHARKPVARHEKPGTTQGPAGRRSGLASRKKPDPIAASISIPGDPVQLDEPKEDNISWAESEGVQAWGGDGLGETGDQDALDKPSDQAGTETEVAPKPSLEETTEKWAERSRESRSTSPDSGTSHRPSKKGRSSKGANSHAGANKKPEASAALNRDGETAVPASAQEEFMGGVSHGDSSIMGDTYSGESSLDEATESKDRKPEGNDDEAVRRLPSVDQADPNPYGGTTGLGSGEVPIYPSTSKG